MQKAMRLEEDEQVAKNALFVMVDWHISAPRLTMPTHPARIELPWLQ
jgi:hypothetical protein